MNWQEFIIHVKISKKKKTPLKVTSEWNSSDVLVNVQLLLEMKAILFAHSFPVFIVFHILQISSNIFLNLTILFIKKDLIHM